MKKAKRVRLSKVDREALQRAIDMVRAESPNETRWIDDHLRSNGFFEAGHLASYHCQYRALKLKPWEFPPVWMDNVTATLKEPHNRIGDVLVEQGSLPAALDSYKASLAIADRLAKADPGNAGWQRDLSVSQAKIGDVLRAQGNLPAAPDSYKASLAIADRLAKADPGKMPAGSRPLRLSVRNYGRNGKHLGRSATAHFHFAVSSLIRLLPNVRYWAAMLFRLLAYRCSLGSTSFFAWRLFLGIDQFLRLASRPFPARDEARVPSLYVHCPVG